MLIWRRSSAWMSVCLLATVGCAARQTAHSNRFIRAGEPSISYDLPGLSKVQANLELSQAQREEIAAHSLRDSSGRTVETTNPEVLDALKIASLKPDAGNFHRVAVVYRRLGIIDKAFDYLTLAIGQQPRSARFLEERAQIWRDWNFPEFGLVDAHKAVFFAPRSASAHSTLGTILHAIGDLSSARVEFETAITLDADAAYALSNLCYLSVLQGDFARAQRECESALALEPDLAVARNNLALAFAAAGDLRRAREEFLRTGDSAAADFNIGVIHMAWGQYAEAADSFGNASNARPSFTAAATEARRARALMNTTRMPYENSRAH